MDITSPVATIGLAVFTILGGLGGLVIIRDWFNRTFWRDAILLRKLTNLATTTTIDTFTSALGAPTFVNAGPSGREYVYVMEKCYVAAVTDPNEKVAVFSVTTTHKAFSPVLRFWTGTSEATVKLGCTKFSELQEMGISDGVVTSGFGNRRVLYKEEYYLGNPGLYQKYIFGINDAGLPSEGHDITSFNDGVERSDDPRVQAHRRDAAINTYAIGAPFFDASSMQLERWIGADLDQVRLLNLR
jgi:hypothetical protein